MKVAFIGFREAGPAFAEPMVRRGARAAVFDLASLEPGGAEAQRILCARAGAAHSGSLAAALDGAQLVVTAGAAVGAAREAAAHLRTGQTYVDLNSGAPATKVAVREAMAQSGATFVEGVAMGRVAEGALPPVLLSGPTADALASTLTDLGWDARSAGAAWGAASTVKLLRSVVVKGLEALLTEAFAGAARADAAQALTDTLGDWAPGIDWRDIAPYHLGRVRVHGARRAQELTECAALLAELGLEAHAVRGAAETQARWAGRAHPAVPGDVS